MAVGEDGQADAGKCALASHGMADVGDGGLGPMLGQTHHFVKFNKGVSDYAEERFQGEAKRLYGVLDKQFKGRDFIAGDYSIADICRVALDQPF